MESLLTIGQDVLIVVVGLIARFLVAVLGFALLLVPIVLATMAWQKVREARDHAAGLDQVGRLKWLREASYSPWHTWLAPAEGGLARLGVDALAERLFAGITGVTLAAPGAVLRAGDAFARVTAGSRAALLRVPVDSRVVSINEALARDPQLLHRDPYRRGWMAVVAPVLGYQGLRTGEPARQWLEAEEHRLERAIEHTLGYAAADGGDLVGPAHRLLTDEQWVEITEQFL
jgi:glycine cleavage system H protein